MSSDPGNAPVESVVHRTTPLQPDTGPRTTKEPLNLPRLPVTLTSFIGREEIMTAVAMSLHRPDTRLLTLVGPGGVGKTRLALRVARQLEPEFADGVGFIGLASVNDPHLVLPTIASRLGLRNVDRQSLMERVQALLVDRSCLLVVDNFEQVVTAGPVLAEIVAACPGTKLLVTSRSPLRVSGERLVPITAMRTSPQRDTTDDDKQSEAVRLFIDRALAVRPDMTLDDATIAAITEICRRLDGLPLAIELAASRSTMFTPTAMLDQLTHRLPLLTNGPQDQPERLQTMHNAVAWSYNLLSDTEQELFRCLSVFTGGFTIAAAAAVCAQREASILLGLEALVHQSLVQMAPEAGCAPRYQMLETIRDFGLDQLAQEGELDHLSALHARYYVAFAEGIEHDVDGRGATSVLPRVDDERHNLRAALEWLISAEQATDALRLATSLWPYWRIRGNLSEGRNALVRALGLPGPVPASLRGDALWKLGYLHFYLGEYPQARSRLEQSIAVFVDVDDIAGKDTALDSLGTVLRTMGEPDLARSCHEQALDIRRKRNDLAGQEMPLANLGMLALDRGDLVEARSLLEESLDLSRRFGSSRSVGNRLLSLGRLEVASGHLRDARETVELARASFERLGDQVAIASSLEVLGMIAGDEGRRDDGTRFLLASLQIRLRLGLRRDLTNLIELLAWNAMPRDAVLATRMLAAADAERDATGIGRLPQQANIWERAIEAAHHTIDDSLFETTWRAGQRMSLIACAREASAALALPATATGDTPSPAGDSPLTPRETEILRLIASGRSNREIADALYISPTTVKRHVTNILAKLALPTRAAAITHAMRSGLIDP